MNIESFNQITISLVDMISVFYVLITKQSETVHFLFVAAKALGHGMNIQNCIHPNKRIISMLLGLCCNDIFIIFYCLVMYVIKCYKI